MNEIVAPVINAAVSCDSRTDPARGLKLGYEWGYIVENILKKGLANFSRGYVPPDSADGPELTAAEVVLLYCFGNMKGHFRAARRVFETHRSSIEECTAKTGRLVVVDVGCGPGTGYLALADVFPGNAFCYYGIDSSAAMRDMAARLDGLLRERGFVSSRSRSHLYDTWDKVRCDEWGSNCSVLFIFSYLFASLDRRECDSLLESVLRIREHRSVVKCFMAYMNSEYEIANATYRSQFRPGLGLPSRDLSRLKQPAALFEFVDISN